MNIQLLELDSFCSMKINETGERNIIMIDWNSTEFVLLQAALNYKKLGSKKKWEKSYLCCKKLMKV